MGLHDLPASPYLTSFNSGSVLFHEHPKSVLNSKSLRLLFLFPRRLFSKLTVAIALLHAAWALPNRLHIREPFSDNLIHNSASTLYNPLTCFIFIHATYQCLMCSTFLFPHLPLSSPLQYTKAGNHFVFVHDCIYLAPRDSVSSKQWLLYILKISLHLNG